jgi:hypothetical protein
MKARRSRPQSRRIFASGLREQTLSYRLSRCSKTSNGLSATLQHEGRLRELIAHELDKSANLRRR